MNTQPRPIPSPPTAAQPAPGALSLQWKRQPLPPRQAVQALDFRAGEIALLEVEDGRVWVTCDGLLEDYFLDAGQRLSFTGPVRLRLSAEGPRAARLLCARHPAEAGVAYPPAATPTAQPLTVVPTAATAPSQRLPRGAISAA
ncbi:MAG: DUF2917 domain-containing protein [Acidovorax sp.]|nr:DUF2917 domain-containing protein [Acidovorax sp.]